MPNSAYPNRIWYALTASWRKRYVLKQYLCKPSLQIKTVEALTLRALQQQEIKVLILDFDGVLGPDHALGPLPTLIPWLNEMYQHFEDQLYILSNKPLPARAAFFAEHYPKVQFIKNVAKKPFPDGLLYIQSLSGVATTQMLLCDDRLLTGILAAELAGIKALWVTEPCRDFMGRFLHEAFFSLLRLLDKAFIHSSTW